LAPALTTIEVPAEKMGERAADFLVRQLNEDRRWEFIELEANLILRGTAIIRKASRRFTWIFSPGDKRLCEQASRVFTPHSGTFQPVGKNVIAFGPPFSDSPSGTQFSTITGES
jgi:hypothetical protein